MQNWKSLGQDMRFQRCNLNSEEFSIHDDKKWPFSECIPVFGSYSFCRVVTDQCSSACPAHLLNGLAHDKSYERTATLTLQAFHLEILHQCGKKSRHTVNIAPGAIPIFSLQRGGLQSTTFSKAYCQLKSGFYHVERIFIPFYIGICV